MFSNKNKRPFKVLKIKENLLKKIVDSGFVKTCDELVVGNCSHRRGYHFQSTRLQTKTFVF